MFSSKPKSQNRIDSLIGAGTRVEGTVIFSGGLRVDGEVKGDVRSADSEAGTLVVSEQARIEGEVHVAHLVVNGAVVGPIHATELLELQPRSRVAGDVHYTSIEMHLGAVVEGRLVHIRAGADAKPVELKLAKSN